MAKDDQKVNCQMENKELKWEFKLGAWRQPKQTKKEDYSAFIGSSN